MRAVARARILADGRMDLDDLEQQAQRMSRQYAGGGGFAPMSRLRRWQAVAARLSRLA